MWIKKLHNQILIGLVAGIVLGLILPVYYAVNIIGSVGDLFVSALKMLIAPLILTSIFVGISSIGDIRKLGSMGKQTVLYYLTTTFIAVLIGIVVVNIIDPGKNSNIKLTEKNFSNAIAALKESGLSIDKVAQFNPKAQKIVNEFTKEYDWSKKKTTPEELEKLRTRLVDEAKISKAKSFAVITKIKNYGGVLKIVAKLRSKGIVISQAEMKKTISAVQKETGLGEAFYKLLKNGLMNPFQSASESNTIGIIVFALLLGGLATTLGDKGKPFIEFMNSFNEIMFKMVDLIIKATPIGVLALMSSLIAKNAKSSEQLWSLLNNVGSYMGTVVIGILIHAFIVLPAILYFFGKMNPLHFFMGMRSALFTAFTTCTSGGTLPLTFKCTQQNLGLSKRVTDFVLPLGATVNMDGTALYESVAVIFIANFLGYELTIVQQIVIFITASVAAVGAATIPSAGLITMTIVLSAVGLPTSGIVIIMAVDRFLDMFRTACNVEGDSIGAAVITYLQKKEGNVD